MMSLIGRILIGVGAAVVVVTALEGRAKADVTFTLNDTTNGVSAQAVFTIVNGEIKIAVTNTESNTANAGQAISQIQFTVGGSTGQPTGFAELVGNTTDFNGHTGSVDAKPPTSTEHWSFQSPSTTASLWTVDSPGLTGYGGKPNYLIAATGSTPDSSLNGNHQPSFIGEVDFYLTDATLPSNGDLKLTDITGLKFAFGTGPDVPLEAAGKETYTPSPLLGGPAAVPEPSSIILVVLGAVGFLGYGLRRHMSR
jgi:hypothetical protein